MKTCIKLLFASLVLFSMNSHADSYASSPWAISTTNPDVHYAYTTRDNYILGQYCYIKKKYCVYKIGLNITCKTGHEYPGLINSDSGSSKVTFVCSYKSGKQNILYLKKFKDVDRILRNSNEVGFALPLTAGKFKVVRFSLDGCSNALQRMRAIARQHMGIGGSNSDNRDEEIM